MVETLTNLDMDVLRTFVTGLDLGSFARAAEKLGRSQSAVSSQLRKLEDQARAPLVRKEGRGLAPTLAGERLLSYARRILALNDEAIDALRGAEIAGAVRLGLPQDFAESWLPAVLGQFARAHPKVRVEVRAERNADLMRRLRKGDLDLALIWGNEDDSPHRVRLAELPICWIGQPDMVAAIRHDGEPLPLVAFEQPCVFRAAGVAALDKRGVAWRIAFSSPSLAGLWAAAEAGLGVTLRTRIGLPRTLATLDPRTSGLPRLPKVALTLHRAEAVPKGAVARLVEILHEVIDERTHALT